MDNLLRCFIALEIPEEIQLALVKVTSKAQLIPTNGFRPVRPGMIHLTLKFLGDTPLSKIPDIKKTLAVVAQSQKPFTLRVEGLGAFASWDHPRTIWVGLTSPPGLLSLAANINQITSQLGFPVENRQFSPHLTLARVSEGADRNKVKQCINQLRQASNVVFGDFTVSQLVLFQSSLQPGGSIYTPLSIHRFNE